MKNFKMNIDPDMLMNAMMLKEDGLEPVVTVLNKYGIYGTKVMTFLMELFVACEQIGGGKNAEG